MAERKRKLSRLLEDSPEKWYWLGFLIGDGTFYDKGCIKICLSPEDREHLEAFVNFVGCGNIRTNKQGYLEWKVMDVETVSEIKHLYNISSNKTICPCDFSSLKEDQLKCLSIGLIDADGSIKLQSRRGKFARNTTTITLKCHGNWVENYNFIFKTNKAKLDRQGYANLCIGSFGEQKKLKSFALENHLPIMKRKWDKIDLNLKIRGDTGYIGKIRSLHNK